MAGLVTVADSGLDWIPESSARHGLSFVAKQLGVLVPYAVEAKQKQSAQTASTMHSERTGPEADVRLSPAKAGMINRYRTWGGSFLCAL